MISALAIQDLRWRGVLLFGNVVRNGEMLGITWYRPGDFSCVTGDKLEIEEREWVLSTMRDHYYGHLP